MKAYHLLPQLSIKVLKKERAAYEIFVGAILLISGFVASFLMVVGILERDIALSLLAYSMSLAGLVVGLHGVLGWVGRKEGPEG
jgi:hypothetical protein